MTLFAESIDGALQLLFGLPLALGALGVLSFWPSVRGHWSGPLLAFPSAFIGVALAYSLLTAQRKDQLMPGQWIWAIVPLVIGLGSVCVWLLKRRKKRGSL